MQKLILLLPLLLLLGCAAKQQNPSNIAYDFWMAQKEHNLQKATQLTIKEDLKSTKLPTKVEIEKIDLQPAKIQNDQAKIPTILTLKTPFPTKEETKISFETVLQKKENEWKVDMFPTKKSLYLALGKSYAQQLGKNLSSTMQTILGDKKQIESIFKQLIEGVQKALKEQSKIN